MRYASFCPPFKFTTYFNFYHWNEAQQTMLAKYDKKKRFWTSDWEAMSKFIVENEAVDLLEKRISQGNMRQFLEENPEQHPPGLNADNEYTITVRRKK